jgi:hypothetical protein
VSNILPLTIEGLVAVLLLLTILYCVRLNKQLKRLKVDETMFKTTIAELVTATETAERAIAGLKVTMREAEQGLGERLKSAEIFSSEIAQQLEAGGEILSRVTQIAGAGNPAPPQPKPATPSPKTILAAAEAFAARNSSRAKGLAA